jgi:hypothetical protein
MRNFNAPMHMEQRRKGTRVRCRKCERETAFFGSKCLECGTAYVKQLRGNGEGFTQLGENRKILRAVNLREDKKAYYKRMAEESRKKFTGGT